MAVLQLQPSNWWPESPHRWHQHCNPGQGRGSMSVLQPSPSQPADFIRSGLNDVLLQLCVRAWVLRTAEARTAAFGRVGKIGTKNVRILQPPDRPNARRLLRAWSRVVAFIRKVQTTSELAVLREKFATLEAEHEAQQWRQLQNLHGALEHQGLAVKLQTWRAESVLQQSAQSEKDNPHDGNLSLVSWVWALWKAHADCLQERRRSKAFAFAIGELKDVASPRQLLQECFLHWLMEHRCLRSAAHAVLKCKQQHAISLELCRCFGAWGRGWACSRRRMVERDLDDTLKLMEHSMLYNVFGRGLVHRLFGVWTGAVFQSEALRITVHGVRGLSCTGASVGSFLCGISLNDEYFETPSCTITDGEIKWDATTRLQIGEGNQVAPRPKAGESRFSPKKSPWSPPLRLAVVSSHGGVERVVLGTAEIAFDKASGVGDSDVVHVPLKSCTHVAGVALDEPMLGVSISRCSVRTDIALTERLLREALRRHADEVDMRVIERMDHGERLERAELSSSGQARLLEARFQEKQDEAWIAVNQEEQCIAARLYALEVCERQQEMEIGVLQVQEKRLIANEAQALEQKGIEEQTCRRKLETVLAEATEAETKAALGAEKHWVRNNAEEAKVFELTEQNCNLRQMEVAAWAKVQDLETSAKVEQRAAELAHTKAEAAQARVESSQSMAEAAWHKQGTLLAEVSTAKSEAEKAFEAQGREEQACRRLSVLQNEALLETQAEQATQRSDVQKLQEENKRLKSAQKQEAAIATEKALKGKRLTMQAEAEVDVLKIREKDLNSRHEELQVAISKLQTDLEVSESQAAASRDEVRTVDKLLDSEHAKARDSVLKLNEESTRKHELAENKLEKHCALAASEREALQNLRKTLEDESAQSQRVERRATFLQGSELEARELVSNLEMGESRLVDELRSREAVLNSDNQKSLESVMAANLDRSFKVQEALAELEEHKQAMWRSKARATEATLSLQKSEEVMQKRVSCLGGVLGRFFGDTMVVVPYFLAWVSHWHERHRCILWSDFALEKSGVSHSACFLFCVLARWRDLSSHSRARLRLPLLAENCLSLKRVILGEVECLLRAAVSQWNFVAVEQSMEKMMGVDRRTTAQGPGRPTNVRTRATNQFQEDEPFVQGPGRPRQDQDEAFGQGPVRPTNRRRSSMMPTLNLGSSASSSSFSDARRRASVESVPTASVPLRLDSPPTDKSQLPGRRPSDQRRSSLGAFDVNALADNDGTMGLNAEHPLDNAILCVVEEVGDSLPGLSVRKEGGKSYVFGDQRVNVDQRNGKVMVMKGGGCKPLREFLKELSMKQQKAKIRRASLTGAGTPPQVASSRSSMSDMVTPPQAA